MVGFVGFPSVFVWEGISDVVNLGTCITISRFGAAAGTLLLPILTNLGGANLAMITCALVLFAAFVICLIWAPETSPQFKQNN